MSLKKRIKKIFCLVVVITLLINNNIYARTSFNDAKSYDNYSLFITGQYGTITFDNNHEMIDNNISGLSVRYEENGKDNNPTYYIDVQSRVDLVVNNGYTINNVYTAIYSDCNLVFTSSNNNDIYTTVGDIEYFPDNANIDSIYLDNGSSDCNLYIDNTYIWSFYNDTYHFKANINMGGLFIKKGNLDIRNNGAFLGRYSLSRSFIQLKNGNVYSSQSFIEGFLADGDYKNKGFIFKNSTWAIYIIGSITLDNGSLLRINDNMGDDTNGLDRPVMIDDPKLNYYNAARIMCNGDFVAKNGCTLYGSDIGCALSSYIISSESISISNCNIEIDGYLESFEARSITIDNCSFNIRNFLTCFYSYNDVKINFSNEDDIVQKAQVFGDNDDIIGHLHARIPSVFCLDGPGNLNFDGINDGFTLKYTQQFGDGVPLNEYKAGDSTDEWKTFIFEKQQDVTNDATLELLIDDNYTKYINNDEPYEGEGISGFDVSYSEDEGYTINITKDITIDIYTDTCRSSNIINCFDTNLKITGNKKITVNYHYVDSKDGFVPIFYLINVCHKPINSLSDDNAQTPLVLNIDGKSYDNPLNIELNIFANIDNDYKYSAYLASFDNVSYVPGTSEKNSLNINNTIVRSNSVGLLDLYRTNLNVTNSKLYLKPYVFENISEFSLIESVDDSNITFDNSTLDVEIDNELLKDTSGMYYSLYTQGVISIKNCKKNSDTDINMIKSVNMPLPLLGVKGVEIENSDLYLVGYSGNILSQGKISIKQSDDNYMYLSSKNDSLEPTIDERDGIFKLPCIYSLTNSYEFSSNIFNSYASKDFNVVDFETTDIFNINNINKYHTISFGIKHEEEPEPQKDPDKPHHDHGSSYVIPKTGIK